MYNFLFLLIPFLGYATLNATLALKRRRRENGLSKRQFEEDSEGEFSVQNVDDEYDVSKISINKISYHDQDTILFPSETEVQIVVDQVNIERKTDDSLNSEDIYKEISTHVVPSVFSHALPLINIHFNKLIDQNSKESTEIIHTDAAIDFTKSIIEISDSETKNYPIIFGKSEQEIIENHQKSIAKRLCLSDIQNEVTALPENDLNIESNDVFDRNVNHQYSSLAGNPMLGISGRSTYEKFEHLNTPKMNYADYRAIPIIERENLSTPGSDNYHAGSFSIEEESVENEEEIEEEYTEIQSELDETNVSNLDSIQPINTQPIQEKSEQSNEELAQDIENETEITQASENNQLSKFDIILINEFEQLDDSLQENTNEEQYSNPNIQLCSNTQNISIEPQNIEKQTDLDDKQTQKGLNSDQENPEEESFGEVSIRNAQFEPTTLEIDINSVVEYEFELQQENPEEESFDGIFEERNVDFNIIPLQINNQSRHEVHIENEENLTLSSIEYQFINSQISQNFEVSTLDPINIYKENNIAELGLSLPRELNLPIIQDKKQAISTPIVESQNESVENSQPIVSDSNEIESNDIDWPNQLESNGQFALQNDEIVSIPESSLNIGLSDLVSVLDIKAMPIPLENSEYLEFDFMQQIKLYQSNLQHEIHLPIGANQLNSLSFSDNENIFDNETEELKQNPSLSLSNTEEVFNTFINDTAPLNPLAFSQNESEKSPKQKLSLSLTNNENIFNIFQMNQHNPLVFSQIEQIFNNESEIVGKQFSLSNNQEIFANYSQMEQNINNDNKEVLIPKQLPSLSFTNAEDIFDFNNDKYSMIQHNPLAFSQIEQIFNSDKEDEEQIPKKSEFYTIPDIVLSKSETVQFNVDNKDEASTWSISLTEYFGFGATESVLSISNDTIYYDQSFEDEKKSKLESSLAVSSHIPSEEIHLATSNVLEKHQFKPSSALTRSQTTELFFFDSSMLPKYGFELQTFQEEQLDSSIPEFKLSNTQYHSPIFENPYSKNVYMQTYYLYISPDQEDFEENIYQNPETQEEKPVNQDHYQLIISDVSTIDRASVAEPVSLETSELVEGQSLDLDESKQLEICDSAAFMKSPDENHNEICSIPSSQFDIFYNQNLTIYNDFTSSIDIKSKPIALSKFTYQPILIESDNEAIVSDRSAFVDFDGEGRRDLSNYSSSPLSIAPESKPVLSSQSQPALTVEPAEHNLEFYTGESELVDSAYPLFFMSNCSHFSLSTITQDLNIANTPSITIHPSHSELEENVNFTLDVDYASIEEQSEEKIEKFVFTDYESVFEVTPSQPVNIEEKPQKLEFNDYESVFEVVPSQTQSQVVVSQSEIRSYSPDLSVSDIQENSQCSEIELTSHNEVLSEINPITQSFSVSEPSYRMITNPVTTAYDISQSDTMFVDNNVKQHSSRPHLDLVSSSSDYHFIESKPTLTYIKPSEQFYCIKDYPTLLLSIDESTSVDILEVSNDDSHDNNGKVKDKDGDKEEHVLAMPELTISSIIELLSIESDKIEEDLQNNENEVHSSARDIRLPSLNLSTIYDILTIDSSTNDITLSFSTAEEFSINDQSSTLSLQQAADQFSISPHKQLIPLDVSSINSHESIRELSLAISPKNEIYDGDAGKKPSTLSINNNQPFDVESVSNAKNLTTFSSGEGIYIPLQVATLSISESEHQEITSVSAILNITTCESTDIKHDTPTFTFSNAYQFFSSPPVLDEINELPPSSSYKPDISISTDLSHEYESQMSSVQYSISSQDPIISVQTAEHKLSSFTSESYQVQSSAPEFSCSQPSYFTISSAAPSSPRSPSRAPVKRFTRSSKSEITHVYDDYIQISTHSTLNLESKNDTVFDLESSNAKFEMSQLTHTQYPGIHEDYSPELTTEIIAEYEYSSTPAISYIKYGDVSVSPIITVLEFSKLSHYESETAIDSIQSSDNEEVHKKLEISEIKTIIDEQRLQSELAVSESFAESTKNEEVQKESPQLSQSDFVLYTIESAAVDLAFSESTYICEESKELQPTLCSLEDCTHEINAVNIDLDKFNSEQISIVPIEQETDFDVSSRDAKFDQTERKEVNLSITSNESVEILSPIKSLSNFNSESIYVESEAEHKEAKRKIISNESVDVESSHSPLEISESVLSHDIAATEYQLTIFNEELVDYPSSSGSFELSRIYYSVHHPSPNETNLSEYTSEPISVPPTEVKHDADHLVIEGNASTSTLSVQSSSPVFIKPLAPVLSFYTSAAESVNSTVPLFAQSNFDHFALNTIRQNLDFVKHPEIFVEKQPVNIEEKSQKLEFNDYESVFEVAPSQPVTDAQTQSQVVVPQSEIRSYSPDLSVSEIQEHSQCFEIELTPHNEVLSEINPIAQSFSISEPSYRMITNPLFVDSNVEQPSSRPHLDLVSSSSDYHFIESKPTLTYIKPSEQFYCIKDYPTLLLSIDESTSVDILEVSNDDSHYNNGQDKDGDKEEHVLAMPELTISSIIELLSIESDKVEEDLQNNENEVHSSERDIRLPSLNLSTIYDILSIDSSTNDITLSFSTAEEFSINDKSSALSLQQAADQFSVSPHKQLINLDVSSIDSHESIHEPAMSLVHNYYITDLDVHTKHLTLKLSDANSPELTQESQANLNTFNSDSLFIPMHQLELSLSELEHQELYNDITESLNIISCESQDIKSEAPSFELSKVEFHFAQQFEASSTDDVNAEEEDIKRSYSPTIDVSNDVTFEVERTNSSFEHFASEVDDVQSYTPSLSPSNISLMSVHESDGSELEFSQLDYCLVVAERISTEDIHYSIVENEIISIESKLIREYNPSLDFIVNSSYEAMPNAITYTLSHNEDLNIKQDEEQFEMSNSVHFVPQQSHESSKQTLELTGVSAVDILSHETVLQLSESETIIDEEQNESTKNEEVQKESPQLSQSDFVLYTIESAAVDLAFSESTYICEESKELQPTLCSLENCTHEINAVNIDLDKFNSEQISIVPSEQEADFDVSSRDAKFDQTERKEINLAIISNESVDILSPIKSLSNFNSESIYVESEAEHKEVKFVSVDVELSPPQLEISNEILSHDSPATEHQLSTFNSDSVDYPSVIESFELSSISYSVHHPSEIVSESVSPTEVKHDSQTDEAVKEISLSLSPDILIHEIPLNESNLSESKDIEEIDIINEPKKHEYLNGESLNIESTESEFSLSNIYYTQYQPQVAELNLSIQSSPIFEVAENSHSLSISENVESQDISSDIKLEISSVYHSLIESPQQSNEPAEKSPISLSISDDINVHEVEIEQNIVQSSELGIVDIEPTKRNIELSKFNIDQINLDESNQQLEVSEVNYSVYQSTQQSVNFSIHSSPIFENAEVKLSSNKNESVDIVQSKDNNEFIISDPSSFEVNSIKNDLSSFYDSSFSVAPVVHKLEFYTTDTQTLDSINPMLIASDISHFALSTIKEQQFKLENELIASIENQPIIHNEQSSADNHEESAKLYSPDLSISDANEHEQIVQIELEKHEEIVGDIKDEVADLSLSEFGYQKLTNPTQNAYEIVGSEPIFVDNKIAQDSEISNLATSEIVFNDFTQHKIDLVESESIHQFSDFIPKQLSSSTSTHHFAEYSPKLSFFKPTEQFYCENDHSTLHMNIDSQEIADFKYHCALDVSSSLSSNFVYSPQLTFTSLINEETVEATISDKSKEEHVLVMPELTISSIIELLSIKSDNIEEDRQNNENEVHSSERDIRLPSLNLSTIYDILTIDSSTCDITLSFSTAEEFSINDKSSTLSLQQTADEFSISPHKQLIPLDVSSINSHESIHEPSLSLTHNFYITSFDTDTRRLKLKESDLVSPDFTSINNNDSVVESVSNAKNLTIYSSGEGIYIPLQVAALSISESEHQEITSISTILNITTCESTDIKHDTPTFTFSNAYQFFSSPPVQDENNELPISSSSYKPDISISTDLSYEYEPQISAVQYSISSQDPIISIQTAEHKLSSFTSESCLIPSSSPEFSCSQSSYFTISSAAPSSPRSPSRAPVKRFTRSSKSEITHVYDDYIQISSSLTNAEDNYKPKIDVSNDVTYEIDLVQNKYSIITQETIISAPLPIPTLSRYVSDPESVPSSSIELSSSKPYHLSFNEQPDLVDNEVDIKANESDNIIVHVYDDFVKIDSNVTLDEQNDTVADLKSDDIAFEMSQMTYRRVVDDQISSEDVHYDIVVQEAFSIESSPIRYYSPTLDCAIGETHEFTEVIHNELNISQSEMIVDEPPHQTRPTHELEISQNANNEEHIDIELPQLSQSDVLVYSIASKELPPTLCSLEDCTHEIAAVNIGLDKYNSEQISIVPSEQEADFDVSSRDAKFDQTERKEINLSITSNESVEILSPIKSLSNFNSESIYVESGAEHKEVKHDIVVKSSQPQLSTYHADPVDYPSSNESFELSRIYYSIHHLSPIETNLSEFTSEPISVSPTEVKHDLQTDETKSTAKPSVSVSDDVVSHEINEDNEISLNLSQDLLIHEIPLLESNLSKSKDIEEIDIKSEAAPTAAKAPISVSNDIISHEINANEIHLSESLSTQEVDVKSESPALSQHSTEPISIASSSQQFELSKVFHSLYLPPRNELNFSVYSSPVFDFMNETKSSSETVLERQSSINTALESGEPFYLGTSDSNNIELEVSKSQLDIQQSLDQPNLAMMYLDPSIDLEYVEKESHKLEIDNEIENNVIATKSAEYHLAPTVSEFIKLGESSFKESLYSNDLSKKDEGVFDAESVASNFELSKASYYSYVDAPSPTMPLSISKSMSSEILNASKFSTVHEELFFVESLKPVLQLNVSESASHDIKSTPELSLNTDIDITDIDENFAKSKKLQISDISFNETENEPTESQQDSQKVALSINDSNNYEVIQTQMQTDESETTQKAALSTTAEPNQFEIQQIDDHERVALSTNEPSEFEIHLTEKDKVALSTVELNEFEIPQELEEKAILSTNEPNEFEIQKETANNLEVSDLNSSDIINNPTLSYSKAHESIDILQNFEISSPRKLSKSQLDTFDLVPRNTVLSTEFASTFDKIQENVDLQTSELHSSQILYDPSLVVDENQSEINIESNISQVSLSLSDAVTSLSINDAEETVNINEQDKQPKIEQKEKLNLEFSAPEYEEITIENNLQLSNQQELGFAPIDTKFDYSAPSHKSFIIDDSSKPETHHEISYSTSAQIEFQYVPSMKYVNVLSETFPLTQSSTNLSHNYDPLLQISSAMQDHEFANSPKMNLTSEENSFEVVKDEIHLSSSSPIIEDRYSEQVLSMNANELFAIHPVHNDLQTSESVSQNIPIHNENKLSIISSDIFAIESSSTTEKTSDLPSNKNLEKQALSLSESESLVDKELVDSESQVGKEINQLSISELVDISKDVPVDLTTQTQVIGDITGNDEKLSFSELSFNSLSEVGSQSEESSNEQHKQRSYNPSLSNLSNTQINLEIGSAFDMNVYTSISSQMTPTTTFYVLGSNLDSVSLDISESNYQMFEQDNSALYNTEVEIPRFELAEYSYMKYNNLPVKYKIYSPVSETILIGVTKDQLHSQLQICDERNKVEFGFNSNNSQTANLSISNSTIRDVMLDDYEPAPSIVEQPQFKLSDMSSYTVKDSKISDFKVEESIIVNEIGEEPKFSMSSTSSFFNTPPVNEPSVPTPSNTKLNVSDVFESHRFHSDMIDNVSQTKTDLTTTPEILEVKGTKPVLSFTSDSFEIEPTKIFIRESMPTLSFANDSFNIDETKKNIVKQSNSVSYEIGAIGDMTPFIEHLPPIRHLPDLEFSHAVINESFYSSKKLGNYDPIISSSYVVSFGYDRLNTRESMSSDAELALSDTLGLNMDRIPPLSRTNTWQFSIESEFTNYNYTQRRLNLKIDGSVDFESEGVASSNLLEKAYGRKVVEADNLVDENEALKMRVITLRNRYNSLREQFAKNMKENAEKSEELLTENAKLSIENERLKQRINAILQQAEAKIMKLLKRQNEEKYLPMCDISSAESYEIESDFHELSVAEDLQFYEIPFKPNSVVVQSVPRKEIILSLQSTLEFSRVDRHFNFFHQTGAMTMSSIAPRDDRPFLTVGGQHVFNYLKPLPRFSFDFRHIRVNPQERGIMHMEVLEPVAHILNEQPKKKFSETSTQKDVEEPTKVSTLLAVSNLIVLESSRTQTLSISPSPIIMETDPFANYFASTQRDLNSQIRAPLSPPRRLIAKSPEVFKIINTPRKISPKPLIISNPNISLSVIKKNTTLSVSGICSFAKISSQNKLSRGDTFSISLPLKEEKVDEKDALIAVLKQRVDDLNIQLEQQLKRQSELVNELGQVRKNYAALINH